MCVKFNNCTQKAEQFSLVNSSRRSHDAGRAQSTFGANCLDKKPNPKHEFARKQKKKKKQNMINERGWKKIYTKNNDEQIRASLISIRWLPIRMQWIFFLLVLLIAHISICCSLFFMSLHMCLLVATTDERWFFLLKAERARTAEHKLTLHSSFD